MSERNSVINLRARQRPVGRPKLAHEIWIRLAFAFLGIIALATVITEHAWEEVSRLFSRGWNSLSKPENTLE